MVTVHQPDGRLVTPTTGAAAGANWSRRSNASRSEGSGQGLAAQAPVPFDCCIITGAGRSDPPQEAWPKPSQWPVSWFTTMVRYSSSGPAQGAEPAVQRSSLMTTLRPLRHEYRG